MHFPVLNKRNRDLWENQAFWVLLPLRLVADGKSDANFFIDHFLCIMYFFRISMSNNSSIAIFPYSYILWMDGILLERFFMDLKLICIMCGESIKNI